MFFVVGSDPIGDRRWDLEPGGDGWQTGPAKHGGQGEARQ